MDRARAGLAVALAVVLSFAAIARGAHDLWAATAVHVLILALTAVGLVLLTFVRGRLSLRLPFLGPIAVVAVAFTLSFQRAANPADAFLAWTDWGAAFLVLWLAANLFTSARAVDAFLAVMVLPLLWQAGAGIAAFVESSLAGGTLRNIPNVAGTLVNANLQAAFSLLWIPLFAARLQSPSAWRPVWMAGLGAALLALVVSQSAWAVVCLLGASPLLVGRAGNRPPWSWKRAALVTLVFFGLVLGLKLLADPHLASGMSSVWDRVRWWRTALAMFLDHPLTGVGLGNFPSAYLAYEAAPGLNTRFAHGLVPSLLSESGFLGAAAYASFVVLVFRRAVRSGAGRSARPFLISAALFLAFTAVHIGHEYLVNLLALHLMLGGVAAQLPSRGVRVRPVAAVLAAGLAVLAVPFLVSPFLAGRLVVAGREALNEGRLDAARKAFHAAADLDARAWEPHDGLALAARAAEDPASVMAHTREAIERNRLNGGLWKRLAATAASLGRTEEAADYARRAERLGVRVELEPDGAAR